MTQTTPGPTRPAARPKPMPKKTAVRAGLTGECPTNGCGLNHNQARALPTRKAMAVKTAIRAGAGDGCPPYGCGSNHNQARAGAAPPRRRGPRAAPPRRALQVRTHLKAGPTPTGGGGSDPPPGQ